MSELLRVRTFFNSKHIHASDVWIDACIDWYKSEHPGPVRMEELFKVLYEQWLLCDLRDLELGCLPENLKSFKKLTLTGKYALQMHYLIDVSTPAYTQLQQIRNVNTTNERVTAETQNESFYAPVKPNRVLNLYLCDGLQEIKGMEYKPIRKLNTKLTPGVKVLIEGPVDCRNGVLFLEEQNIQVLGGEIEDLLIKNAYENVLARLLKLDENPNPNRTQAAQTTIQSDIDDSLFAQIDFEDDDVISSTAIPNRATTNQGTNFPATVNPAKNQPTRTTAPSVIKPIVPNLSPIAQARKEFQECKQAKNQPTRTTAPLANKPIVPNLSPIAQARKEFQECKLANNQPTRTTAPLVNKPIVPNLSPIAQARKEFQKCKQTFPDEDEEFNDHELMMQQFEQELQDADFDDIIEDEQPVKIPPAKTEITPIVVSHLPYVYIKQILDKLPSLPKTKYVIKGRIQKLLNKLLCPKKKWTLKCIVEDCSGEVVVDVADKVLAEIIGLTGDEAHLLKRQFNTSNFHKEQLVQALEMAKKKITTMDCLMTIDFENIDEPVMCSFREMVITDFGFLEKRVQCLQ